ncbi:MAG TPA: nitroreductase family deazaflavin-dependent oxidoreductase [Acidimicrobiia bacterium]|nr:nitroreductase family deazaflavin-dependent oxidoreductase [Acidimicrobiia bacterium]
MRDSSVRRWSSFHALLYRLTGGRVGRRLVGNDMLLLTTRGHETGNDHTVPLLFLRDGTRLVVVASYGGRPDHPTWYHNLVAEPKVTVRLGAKQMRMTTRTADPDEREVWWPRVVAAYDGYATYQSRTGREIPVVFLEPANTVEAQ